MNIRSFRRFLLAAGALAISISFTAAAKAEIVFDNLGINFPAHSGNWWLPGEPNVEIGDEIFLAGKKRNLTEAVIPAVAHGSVDAEIILSLYAQDGPSGKPGSLIHRTDPLPKTLTPAGEFLTFDLPHVLVPDRFTWTVRFDNVVPGEAGVLQASFHTVGTSPQHGWLWFESTGFVQNIPAGSWKNFRAQFTAVPEPSAGKLAFGFALAACGLKLIRLDRTMLRRRRLT